MDFDLLFIISGITAWIFISKWFRYQRESRLEALKSPQKSPEQEAEVHKLRDRVENLETLICRLDSEINYQLERSLSKTGISTSPVESLGNSQMPTTFMNIASVLESRY